MLGAAAAAYSASMNAYVPLTEARLDEAAAEVGLGTARVWGLYMAGSRLGFERNVVQLDQVLAVKVDERGGGVDLPLRPCGSRRPAGWE
jgi:cyclopropane-fatty-acyl-phospholipid synthase